MTCFALNAHEKRVGLRGVLGKRVLQSGPVQSMNFVKQSRPRCKQTRKAGRSHVLETVQGGHTVVVISRCHKNGRELAVFRNPDVVEGGVSEQRLELSFRFFRAAVIRAPSVTNGKLVKAEHISDRNLADDAAEQVRSLIGTNSDQQSSVASTLNGQLCRGRVACNVECQEGSKYGEGKQTL